MSMTKSKEKNHTATDSEGSQKTQVVNISQFNATGCIFETCLDNKGKYLLLINKKNGNTIHFGRRW